MAAPYEKKPAFVPDSEVVEQIVLKSEGELSLEEFHSFLPPTVLALYFFPDRLCSVLQCPQKNRI